MSIRLLKLVVLGTLVALYFAGSVDARGSGTSRPQDLTSRPPLPIDAFRPSNARTGDGGLIPVDAFFPAARCAECHHDVHAAWSQSLHRNAARDPFYRESADILLRSRGIEYTRHCESCHTPVALFSGALTTGSTVSRAKDDEGVSCTVCHSIEQATTDGTGSYTIRRPALLEREDGTLVYGDLPNAEILSHIADHKRAVMRPLLRTPEFCATCHKVATPADLNGYKNVKGFSAYDEWQQSGASHESATSWSWRDDRTTCQQCHMPKVPSFNDEAAKQGKIASHAWLGANTAAPSFYGQTEQVGAIEAFLENHVLDVDVFAVTDAATREQTAGLGQGRSTTVAARLGDEITAEVVVSNRNAAHSFPPEVRDLYEAWVEFEAVDADGKTVYRSGYLEADGTLDTSAHVYKTMLLDDEGRPLTRHQVWLTTVKAYDNAILPGRSDVVRYRFRTPAGAGPLTLHAKVNYRRFNQEYASYVLARRSASLVLPVVTMAETEAEVTPGAAIRDSEPGSAKERTALATRWSDYGKGLMEQSQFGPAARAFARASELVPANADFVVNEAVAEMRTERFGPDRAQFHKAEALLDRALTLRPGYARARFYRALVLRGEGRAEEAASELEAVVAEYPRDREAERQLGETLLALGRTEEAGRAFEAVVAIDPLDAGAYQYLASSYRAQGRTDDAARAESLYLSWRDDPAADAVAGRFYAAHPEWADERSPFHTHGDGSPLRPVLVGASAAPDH